jgi:hypothetical protein
MIKDIFPFRLGQAPDKSGLRDAAAAFSEM